MMKLRLIGLVLLGLSTLTQNANADFLAPFTGNSQFIVPGAASDGVVNFTVFDNSGGDLGALLTANGVVPLSIAPFGFNDAKYAYFYQVVNTNPDNTGNFPGDFPESALTALAVTTPYGAGGFLEAGFLLSRVFDELGSGDTGPAGNTRLGGLESTPGSDVPGDQTPTNSTGSLDATPFDPNLLAINPISVFANGNTIQFNFTVPPGIATTLYSSVFFFTSNSAPSYIVPSTLFDAGPTTNGDIPVPTPELGTFLMGFTAVVCGIAVIWCARRQSVGCGS